MKKIILATASPYRKRAFETLGIDFEICPSDIDERFKNRPKDPRKLVLELAKRKCEAVAERYKKGIIIGFDSVAYCNGKILEKPKNLKEAKKRILMMSSRKFDFYTGLYIKDIESGKNIGKIAETKGEMRKISKEEVDFYHKQDQKGIGYAIGFDVKYNFSSTFVKEIRGSYLNFLDGIPLEEILEMLYKIGFKLPEKPKMKITVSGSIKFADRLVEVYRELEKMGYDPMMHEEMFGIADGSAKKLLKGIATNHAKIKRENKFIKWWHDCIKSGDAILVCNYDKNGIKNYIGGNTLMEIGFAHVNDKKVFLLNPIPEDVSYIDEIKAMVDVVLKGNLNKIK
ncbi:MAG: Maf family protein [Parcubacteria group bacterium]|jgi:septum formation protein